MVIKYLISSWHQNHLVINGISGIVTEVFFISHYSFLAALSNSDSAIRHIRFRDTINPISYVILPPFI